MRRLIGAVLLVIFSVVLLPTVSHSAAVDFLLLDHGDGGLGPNYGLRVDELGGAPPTYSASNNGASLTLSYDAAALTAVISGTVYKNGGGGLVNGGAMGLVNVMYNLSGIAIDGNGGFTATGGSGNVGGIGFSAKQNGAGFGSIFAFDGHRINGDTTTPVFRGWIMTAFTPSGGYKCCNDFLVRAVRKPPGGPSPVPLPAPLWMLLATLLGVGGVRIWRRRRAAS